MANFAGSSTGGNPNQQPMSTTQGKRVAPGGESMGSSMPSRSRTLPVTLGGVNYNSGGSLGESETHPKG